MLISQSMDVGVGGDTMEWMVVTSQLSSALPTCRQPDGDAADDKCGVKHSILAE